MTYFMTIGDKKKNVTHIDARDNAIRNIDADGYDGLLLDFDGTICQTKGIYDTALERPFENDISRELSRVLCDGIDKNDIKVLSIGDTAGDMVIAERLASV